MSAILKAAVPSMASKGPETVLDLEHTHRDRTTHADCNGDDGQQIAQPSDQAWKATVTEGSDDG